MMIFFSSSLEIAGGQGQQWRKNREGANEGKQRWRDERPGRPEDGGGRSRWRSRELPGRWCRWCRAADARGRHLAHLLRPLMGIPFPPLLAAAALLHCSQAAALLVYHHDLAVKKSVACSVWVQGVLLITSRCVYWRDATRQRQGQGSGHEIRGDAPLFYTSVFVFLIFLVMMWLPWKRWWCGYSAPGLRAWTVISFQNSEFLSKRSEFFCDAKRLICMMLV